MFAFRIPHSAFRIPHSAFRIPHSAFRIPQILTILIILLSSISLKAQNGNQLIRIHAVANTTDMNAISSPNEGNLVYVQSNDEIYYYDGSAWESLSSGGSSNGWGLNGNSITSNDFLGSTNNQDLNLVTNNANRMTVKNDGKVGVNLTNPTGMFQIRANDIVEITNGSATSNATSTESAGNSTYGPHSPDHAYDNDPNSYWHSQAVGSAHFNYWFKIDCGSSRVVNKYRIKPKYEANSGLPFPAVHYGPTNFEFQGSNDNINWTNLDVKHEDSTWIYSDLEVNILNTTAYRYYRWFMHRGYYQNGVAWITKFLIEEFDIYGPFTSSSNDFIVTTNGRVGIGTDNPSEKLHVIGNILATGTITTPDYVFEHYFEGKSELKPDYQLKPLAQTINFAKTHKHLPGIPSAKDVEEKGGIILNNAVEQNLEKIEELHIYIYQLTQEVERLNKMLNEEIKNEIH